MSSGQIKQVVDKLITQLQESPQEEPSRSNTRYSLRQNPPPGLFSTKKLAEEISDYELNSFDKGNPEAQVKSKPKKRKRTNQRVNPKDSPKKYLYEWLYDEMEKEPNKWFTHQELTARINSPNNKVVIIKSNGQVHAKITENGIRQILKSKKRRHWFIQSEKGWQIRTPKPHDSPTKPHETPTKSIETPTKPIETPTTPNEISKSNEMKKPFEMQTPNGNQTPNEIQKPFETPQHYETPKPCEIPTPQENTPIPSLTSSHQPTTLITTTQQEQSTRYPSVTTQQSSPVMNFPKPLPPNHFQTTQQGVAQKVVLPSLEKKELQMQQVTPVKVNTSPKHDIIKEDVQPKKRTKLVHHNDTKQQSKNGLLVSSLGCDKPNKNVIDNDITTSVKLLYNIARSAPPGENTCSHHVIVPISKSVKFFIDGEKIGRKLFLAGIKGPKQLEEHITNIMLDEQYANRKFEMRYKETGDSRLFLLKPTDCQMYWNDFLKYVTEINIKFISDCK